MYKRLSELEGYQNCDDYLIYDDGRVYSEKSGRFLNGCHDSKGYLYLDIRGRKCENVCPKIHRLVAQLFIGEPNGLQVNHKDGNKENNAVSNLEYVTHEENRIHAINTGLKNEIPYGIIMCDLEGNELRYFRTCQDAIQELGIKNGNPGNIGRVIRGKRKTAYGYKWKSYEGSTTIPLAD